MYLKCNIVITDFYLCHLHYYNGPFLRLCNRRQHNCTSTGGTLRVCICMTRNISGPSSDVARAVFINRSKSVTTWHVYKSDSLDDRVPFTHSIQCMGGGRCCLNMWTVKGTKKGPFVKQKLEREHILPTFFFFSTGQNIT